MEDCYSNTTNKKRSDSDPEDMKNFRPVSNLSYISKLTEKIVMKQIDEHLDNDNLQEPLQSAYRSNHSIETALVKIVNDLGCEVDNKKCVLLVLLDMSAAFGTVEQSTLLKRFENDFGIEGSANQWLRSYITGRSKRVNLSCLVYCFNRLLFFRRSSYLDTSSLVRRAVAPLYIVSCLVAPTGVGWRNCTFVWYYR